MTEKPNIETLDITKLICPMTFVRTKLKLEKMQPGDVLQVRLKGAEPLENVPRSTRQHGHTVVALEPDAQSDDGTYILTIKREVV